jgi:hypothetical protein
MTTEQRKIATDAKAKAFIEAVQAVMAAHEVTSFEVEMESGRGHAGYNGAHIEIEFKAHSTETSYEYFNTVEISRIEI